MLKFKLFSRAAATALIAGKAPAGLSADVLEIPAGEGEDGQGDDQGDGSDGAPPNPAEPDGGEPAPAVTAALPPGDYVAMADAQSIAAERFDAGVKAERDRTAAVLSSESGKKNMAMASWLLANSPQASADGIIKQLGTLPAGSQSIPDTNIDLGLKTGDDEEKDIWASRYPKASPAGAAAVSSAPMAPAASLSPPLIRGR